MMEVHRWWEGIPGERFWLGVTGRNGKGELLAAPCGGGRCGAPAWLRPLITHVRAGDAVFHFDETHQAIVAWSTTRGRVQKRPLVWAGRTETDEPETRQLPSWSVELADTVALDSPVTLDEIARVQWELFPALREFEDKVGEPLYYPFAMGSPYDTRLLAGYVFKLPSLFVECVPALARAARQIRWADVAREREFAPVTPSEGALPQPVSGYTR